LCFLRSFSRSCGVQFQSSPSPPSLPLVRKTLGDLEFSFSDRSYPPQMFVLPLLTLCGYSILFVFLWPSTWGILVLSQVFHFGAQPETPRPSQALIFLPAIWCGWHRQRSWMVPTSLPYLSFLILNFSTTNPDLHSSLVRFPASVSLFTFGAGVPNMISRRYSVDRLCFYTKAKRPLYSRFAWKFKQQTLPPFSPWIKDEVYLTLEPFPRRTCNIDRAAILFPPWISSLHL